MKQLLLLILATVTSCGTTSSQEEADSSASSGSTPDAQLVWKDEFDGNTIDTTRWTIITGNGCPELCGFGNNERQTYTSNHENLRVEGGRLHIVARKDSRYTSAKLVTENKGDWQYGYIEVKARLPEGRGTWPAIWMLPTLDRRMRWPKDGEIDIMEHVGYNQGMVYTTIHTEKYNHTRNTQKWDSLEIKSVSDKFHVYGFNWTEEELTWYVDGERVFNLKKGSEDKAGWPFDNPFHLILNTAIGGNWGGRKGIDDTIWPQTFEIDYARVYDRFPY